MGDISWQEKQNSFGPGDADAWVFKLDSAGDVTWQKTYGVQVMIRLSLNPADAG